MLGKLFFSQKFIGFKDSMVYVIAAGKSVNQVVVNYLVALSDRVQSSHLQFD